MEQTMKKLVEQISESMGDNSNFLIVLGQNDGDTGITAQGGDIMKLAQTLFYLIHQNEKPLSMNVYNIIKLIVVNMVKNNSDFGKDLLSAVTHYISIQDGK